jgi:hypothetical protein
MAMLQPPPPTTNQRSGDNVLTMEKTTTNTTKQQQEQPEEEEVDCSKEFSHLTISDDSIHHNHASETRPSEAVNVTNQQPSSSSSTQQRNMKLIVRSQYWGRTLKGKTCRTPASLNRPFRTIASQAVLYNTDEYWGCCPHHGKRVLELQECHFQDATPDQDWDLYAVQSWSSPSYSINDFFLLPRNQTVMDVSRNIILSGWTFVGTCAANNIRNDLDSYLRPWLEENDQFGYRYHHVHIEIMMNSAFDRETPRSRKVNNEKARQERHEKHGSTTQPESSESTDDAHSSEREGPPSVPGNAFVLRTPAPQTSSGPPIPHVISNDSSSAFSHSVASSAMTPYHDVHGYPLPDSTSFWTRHTAAPPRMHHPAASPHMALQWYPGATHPSLTPAAHHQPPQYGWHAHASMPPPPPSMHGQMASPALSHGSHMSATELQQYLMYSDPSMGPPPPPQQYHYHGNMPPTPSGQHSYGGGGRDTTAVLRGHVPNEIAGHSTLGVACNHTKDGPAAGVQYVPSTPTKAPTSAATAETGTTALSVSTTGTTPVEDSVVIGEDTVVTTITTNHMVSSRCWSPTGKAHKNSPSHEGAIGTASLGLSPQPVD